MNLRGFFCFLISTSLAIGAEKPALIKKDDKKLSPDLIKTHLFFAIDEYQSLKDAYDKTGPVALKSEFSYLSDENQKFLQKRLQGLKPLPDIQYKESDSFVVQNTYTVKVLSFQDPIKFKINDQEISFHSNASLEESLKLIESALKTKTLSWLGFELIPNAHASGALLALGAIGILLAGLFGARSYSSYKDSKRSEESDFSVETASKEQREAFYKTHGLNADGSRNFGFMVRSGRAFRSFWSSSSTKDKASSAEFYPNNSYSNNIKDAIRKLGPNSAMLKNPPKDLSNVCPNFASLSDDEKSNVWVAIFDSMSMAESGHDPNVHYAESFGVVSRGLLQISWASARGHGGHCSGANSTNLHDPSFNLKCGVKIMEDQIQKRGALFPTPSYYWSVLNHSAGSGFKRFSSRLNHIKTNPQRWPVACNQSATIL